MLFRATILAAIITGTLALESTVSAAWVDDWLNQRTTTSPNYLAGQQRGYYSGGGFSARWPSTVDYPI
ncbi:MAG: conjugal transfer protein TraH, partial [Thermodesulfobacteriota bacterium]|nr:conjugal transfer protein TraH [Thermodesulfobacteriota bacterium]